jgi:hypothetical protein
LRVGAIPVTAALSALAGSATTIVTAWLRARARRLQSRDRSRRNAVRDLPPGSRIVDLGRHGVIIEVGSKPGGPLGG